MALCVIGCTISLALIIAVYILKKSVVIRRSQPIFLVLSITGTLLLNLSIAAFIGPNTNLNCRLRPWCFNIAATFMLAPIFAKLRRVRKIFDAGTKKLVVTDLQVVSLVLFLLLIDVFILLFWNFIEQPGEAIITTYDKSVLGPIEDSFCNTSINSNFDIVMLVYKILILLASTNLARSTWNISSEYSEAKQFAVAIYIILIFGTVAYFISATVSHSNPVVAVILRVIGIFLAATTTVIVIMIPKLRLIYNNNDHKVLVLSSSKEPSVSLLKSTNNT